MCGSGVSVLPVDVLLTAVVTLGVHSGDVLKFVVGVEGWVVRGAAG